MHTANSITSSQDFLFECVKRVINLKNLKRFDFLSQDLLKTADFRKKREDGSCPVKRGASRSKWESWNRCNFMIKKIPRGFKIFTRKTKNILFHFLYHILGLYFPEDIKQ